ncbi:lytic transglycosylase domain-containing protein [Tolumonas lignilytica]|uniref:lytic transglycosylase domain-containing protein n=1 Tax=Tolumonas lignilytica TaxID=1283284 RepID=UPI000464351A|nr:transglycosylase SLT domain-containing protein [Tolumonas lignilytica]
MSNQELPDLSSYDSLINQAAQKYDVDPLLIKSVIATESSGKSDAIGKPTSAGQAVGLMQLMPSIQKAYGVTDPKDPSQNINAGVALLADNLKQYGNPQAAVLAFNGGSDQSNWNPDYANSVIQKYRQYQQQQPQQQTQLLTTQENAPDVFTQRFGDHPQNEQDPFSRKFLSNNQSQADESDPFTQRFLSKQQPQYQQTLEQKANSDVPTDENLAASTELANQRAEKAKIQSTQEASKPADVSNNLGIDISIPSNSPFGKPSPLQPIKDAANGLEEAATSAITGATTGQAAGAVGAAQAIMESIGNGTFGTQQAADEAEKLSQQYQQAATYQPQSEQGQKYTEMLGDTFSKFAPLLPESSLMSDIGEMAGNAGNSAKFAATKTSNTMSSVKDLWKPEQEWEGSQSSQPAKSSFGGESSKSAGAAEATPESIVRSTVSNSSPELQAEVEDAISSKHGVNDIDQGALNRQAVADKFGINLTAGQASRDAQLFSDEKNLRGEHAEFAQRFADQQQSLSNSLQKIKAEAAPDVYASTPVEHGDNMIDAYQQLIDKKNEEIDGKYQALRDAAGGSFPVDTGALYDNITEALGKQLLTHDAPQSQLNAIEEMAASGQMSFEQYLNLRRNLGNVARTAQDGNTRHAASIMIDQLENIPLNDDVAKLKPLADDARSTARAFYQMQEADPALKAVVQGKASPDRFINKYIINADTNKVQQMMNNLQDYPLAQQTAAAGLMDYLSPKGTREITQDALNRGIQNVQSKIPIVMPQEQANNLRDLGSVAEWMQKQPPGSYVNNSNTNTSAMRYATNAAMKAVGQNPVINIASDALSAIKTKRMLDKHLKPGAGIRYSER